MNNARSLRRAALAAALALAPAALAAPALAQEAAPAVQIKPKSALAVNTNIQAATLDNGLQLIVIEDHALPLVTVEIAVKNGAFTEPPEFNGLSHLYEHMFFKANKAIPSQERYLERTRELGLSWNGTTSDERVNYFFTMGSGRAEEGVKFMADALLTPLFNEEELVKERVVVTGELDRNEANPYFHLFQAMSARMFWKYPTRKDTIGDRQTILTATREKMEAMKARYYVPNNTALVLAGDITLDQAKTLANTYFGPQAWPKGKDPFAVDPIPAHPPLKKAEAFIVNQEVKTVSIQLGWHGPSVGKDPASTYAADVFHFILGQQASSFQKALVDTGLALQVGASYYTLNHTGPITITLVTTADKAEQAVTALKAEIARFHTPGYFSDEQINTAKTLLAIDFLYSTEKTSNYAHTVSFWWAVAGLDYLKTYLDKLNAITRADIERYLNTYVYNKPYVMGVLISPEQQKAIGLDDKKVNTWAAPIKPAAAVKVKPR